MADDTTPADLERQLGVDQNRIRHYLRQRYGHLPAYTDNWHLNFRAANDVRDHFRAEAHQQSSTTAAVSAAARAEPALFYQATGTTTVDENGRLVYLPGPGEEDWTRDA